MLGLLVPGVKMGGGAGATPITGFGRIEYTVPRSQIEYTVKSDRLEYTARNARLEFTGRVP